MSRKTKYPRRKGDGLCADDPRLTHAWEWCRIASGYNDKELKRWTHFQSSQAEFHSWTLEAVQWSDCYEARIEYRKKTIASVKKATLSTRVDAQIEAERLLVAWIKGQFALFTARI